MDSYPAYIFFGFMFAYFVWLFFKYIPAAVDDELNRRRHPDDLE